MGVRTPSQPLAGEPPALFELALRVAARAPALTLLGQLGSSLRGLTEDDAADRASREGAVGSACRGTVAGLAAVLGGPFVPLLTALAVVFALLGDLRGAVTVTATIAVSVGLRVMVRRRAARAVAGLGVADPQTASVRRRASVHAASVTREVPVADVVAGDVVELVAGEIVPADVRLLVGRRLRVDQSVLSGETRPAVKDAAGSPHRPHARRAATQLLDLPSMAFAGTTVVSGRATALVLATGPGTVLGAAERAVGAPRAASSVDRGVRQVGATFLRFILVLVPLVAAASGPVTGQWARAGLLGLAVAVGLTPQLLPAIVTAGLARAAAVLARGGLVVNRLDALGDLGGMDVLCVDKTGTLTSDRVEVAHSLAVDGRLDETAAGHAFLITRFQTGPPAPLDQALAAHVGAAEELLAAARYRLVEEIPFDHDRRYATVVLRSGGKDLMVTRGNPEQVLHRCTRARRGTTCTLLTETMRALALDCAAAHENHGLRLLAVAAREPMPARSTNPSTNVNWCWSDLWG